MANDPHAEDERGLRRRPVRAVVDGRPVRRPRRRSRSVPSRTGLAALLTGVPSPVESIGNRAIDMTPRFLKEFAIRQFGTNDKPVLIGGMIVTLLVVAAIAGWIGTRRPRVAYGVFIVLGLLALGAAALDRTATAPRALTLVPALVTAVVSIGCARGPAPVARARSEDRRRRLRRLRSPCLPPRGDGSERRDRSRRCRHEVPRPEHRGRVSPRRRAPARGRRRCPRRRRREAGRQGRQQLHHAQPRLLPHRHRAERAEGAGRGIHPPHPRHGRPRARPQLPRPAQGAPRREAHHPDLRVERGRRAVRRQRRLARRPGPRPARLAPASRPAPTPSRPRAPTA